MRKASIAALFAAALLLSGGCSSTSSSFAVSGAFSECTRGTDCAGPLNRAATAIPHNGSVTQSSNVVTVNIGGSDVAQSADRGVEVTVTFNADSPNGLDFALEVLEPGSADMTLSMHSTVTMEGLPAVSRAHVVRTIASLSLTISVSSAGFERAVVEVSGTVTTTLGNLRAYVYTDHTGTTLTSGSTSDADYLSGEFWLYLPVTASVGNEVEIGAFIDTDAEYTSAGMSALTATEVTYVGVSQALTNEDDGIYAGVVRLTANFDGNTIVGGIFHNEAASTARIVLKSAAIDDSVNGGFFYGDVDYVEDPDTTHTDIGKWGGIFIGEVVAGENPEKVAGTFSGSEGNAADDYRFIGTFAAYEQ